MLRAALAVLPQHCELQSARCVAIGFWCLKTLNVRSTNCIVLSFSPLPYGMAHAEHLQLLKFCLRLVCRLSSADCLWDVSMPQSTLRLLQDETSGWPVSSIYMS